jgi:thiol:disulfide interchange protein DsbD
VLGIAVTFSTLGVIAAKTRVLFGSFGQHPVIQVIIAGIFLAMGLSMLGAFSLQMPSSVSSKLQGRKGKGFTGAFLTGLVGGLIVSPCISPLLVVILTWVAQTGSAVLGFSLLFTFALGLGVLFILIGTFSGIIKSLPKSGGWMELIERGFGVILVGLALVFLGRVLPEIGTLFLWSLFLILLGTFMGAFSPLSKESRTREKTGKGLGIIVFLLGGYLLFFAAARYFDWNPGTRGVSQVQEPDALHWTGDDEQAFEEAARQGKPVLMDFYAEWCTECKEMDKNTFSDNQVKKLLQRMVLLKMDMTEEDSPRVRNWIEKYKIPGAPTVIFFNERGGEISRFFGYKSAEEFKEFVRKSGVFSDR